MDLLLPGDREMSQVLDFYRGQATDTERRRLQEIWGWTNEEFEEVHDFIQWLFPLPEPSRYNPDAPLLTEDDIAAFQREPPLRDNLLRSFLRFLAFLGLSLGEDGRVVEGENFPSRVPDVWSFTNHNWLRITRVLRSLCLLGLGPQARALHDWLDATHRSHRFPIPEDTVFYWTEAVREEPSPR
jgi:hypothetical protein